MTEPLVVPMSTPPDSLKLPLFTQEQLLEPHQMYEQAPSLYPKFQTRYSVARPTFLLREEPEGKRRWRTEEREEEEKGRGPKTQVTSHRSCGCRQKGRKKASDFEDAACNR